MINAANTTIHKAETRVYTLQKPHCGYPLRTLQDQYRYTMTELSEIFKSKSNKVLKLTNLIETEPKTTTGKSTRVEKRGIIKKTFAPSARAEIFK